MRIYFFGSLKAKGAQSGQPIAIRTCTVNRLLDSDGAHSSFTLQLDDGTSLTVTSGLIASCQEDGCNRMPKIFSSKLVVVLLLYFVYIQKEFFF